MDINLNHYILSIRLQQAYNKFYQINIQYQGWNKNNMSDSYKNKLSSFNETIQSQKANLSKAQSKVISNTQKSMNRSMNSSLYSTPIKHSSGGLQNNRTNSTFGSNNNSPNMLNVPNPQNNSSGRNQCPNRQNNQNVNDINASRLRQEEQQRMRQREREKQLQLQRQRMIQAQKEREKQLEKERLQNQKQLEGLLASAQKLRDALQQKAKFIEIEYQKQRIYWNDQKKKYEKKIEDLQNKIVDKDKKIQQLIQNIAYLKQQLKNALQKIEEQVKTIAQLRQENKNYKQQNTIIKLQNKNLKADNKVVLTHLDKLINQKIKDNQKTAKQIFQERQKRVIDSLYRKTTSNSPLSQIPIVYPSDLNELSNKLKLDKMFQDYTSYRNEATKRIKQLESKEKANQSQIQSHKSRIELLQEGLKKVNQLRDMERETNKKQERIIKQYQKQLSQTTVHNERISEELQRFYRVPKIKQKIGCIVSTPRQFRSYTDF